MVRRVKREVQVAIACGQIHGVGAKGVQGAAWEAWWEEGRRGIVELRKNRGTEETELDARSWLPEVKQRA